MTNQQHVAPIHDYRLFHAIQSLDFIISSAYRARIIHTYTHSMAETRHNIATAAVHGHVCTFLELWMMSVLFLAFGRAFRSMSFSAMLLTKLPSSTSEWRAEKRRMSRNGAHEWTDSNEIHLQKSTHKLLALARHGTISACYRHRSASFEYPRRTGNSRPFLYVHFPYARQPLFRHSKKHAGAGFGPTTESVGLSFAL